MFPILKQSYLNLNLPKEMKIHLQNKVSSLGDILILKVYLKMNQNPTFKSDNEKTDQLIFPYSIRCAQYVGS